MDDRLSPTSTYELERDERYRIYGPSAKLEILNQLFERQALIRVQPRGFAEPLLSALLLVDAAHSVLIFDGGRDASMNERLERAESLTIVTDLDGIRVEFQMTALRPIPVEGGVAFQGAFPESILRLQRREFFRIAPPPNQPILVRLNVPLGLEGSIATARGVDISCGGMVLLFDGPLSGLNPGQILPKTTITLPGVATIEAGLEVRNIVYSERSGRGGSTRVGCRFVGINQASSAKVQRYINRLEVERRRRT